MNSTKGSAERDTRVVLKGPPERTGPSLPSIAALPLLLLLLTGCATTRQSIEVRVEAAESDDVKCVAVYKVEAR